MPVSIYDIAKKANVAPSTVSRALQNNTRIGLKTRERIQAIARELDFVPNTVARSLSVSRTYSIGVVTASISDPFMGRVVEGIEHIAIESGFNVLLSTSQNDQQRELAMVDIFQQRRADGIVVMSSHLFDHYNDYVRRINVPVVIINEQNPPSTVASVSVDDVAGAHAAVEHLLGLGHRRIGYVGIPNRRRSNDYRLKGYRSALATAGIGFDEALVYNEQHVESHIQRGEASVNQLLAAGATAVFCYNDSSAIGVLAGCTRRSVAVPADFSVIGFDDIEFAQYITPPLTTIQQPRFELGACAMHMMIALLEGQQPSNTIIPFQLVVRDTTARIQR